MVDPRSGFGNPHRDRAGRNGYLRPHQREVAAGPYLGARKKRNGRTPRIELKRRFFTHAQPRHTRYPAHAFQRRGVEPSTFAIGEQILDIRLQHVAQLHRSTEPRKLVTITAIATVNAVDATIPANATDARDVERPGRVRWRVPGTGRCEGAHAATGKRAHGRAKA